MSKQTELKFPDRWLAKERFPELRELCREVADRHGRKDVADELKIAKSSLDNILAGRERHSLKAKSLLVFARKDPRIPEWFAEFCGGHFEREHSQTPEEELAALKAAVRSMGIAGDAIFAIAKGVR